MAEAKKDGTVEMRQEIDIKPGEVVDAKLDLRTRRAKEVWSVLETDQPRRSSRLADLKGANG